MKNRKNKAGYYTWWCFFITLILALALSSFMPDAAVQLFFVGLSGTVVITTLLTSFSFKKNNYKPYLIIVPFFAYLIITTYISLSIESFFDKFKVLIIGMLAIFLVYYLLFSRKI